MSVLLYLAFSLLFIHTNAQECTVMNMEGHTVPELITTKQPYQYIDMNSLPKAWDWRNVGGVNYVTPDLNQHIPVYCGSCWAHGAVSSFMDRIKITRKARWPDYQGAIQYILNCGTGVAGSCHGGSHSGAFQFIHDKGLPIGTCLQYEAQDFECTAENTCRNCKSPASEKNCFAVTNFTSFYVDQYGKSTGVDKIKAEIYARGPVATGVNASPLHDKYTGGVYNESCSERWINHIVSIAGWGVDDDGQEYWIVRNSWGQYFGENGWFRIKLGVDCLGIEASVYWATPKKTWPE